jgi:hypothetical protein
MPNSDAHSADHATSWQGVSGRLYGIVSESLDGFTLRENHLYLIAGA